VKKIGLDVSGIGLNKKNRKSERLKKIRTNAFYSSSIYVQKSFFNENFFGIEIL